MSRSRWSAPFVLAALITMVMSAAVSDSQSKNMLQLGMIQGDLRLGDPCRSSLECLHHLHHSHCDFEKKVCVCQPYHVPFNRSFCLPASLLGYSCAVDEQCAMKVKESECAQNKLCQCRPGYLPLRKDKCLPPAAVGDFCLNDAQCHLADKLTRCSYILPKVYGKCVCPTHVTNDGRCLPNLGGDCSSDEDCQRTTPEAVCRMSKCQCPDGYRTSRNRLACHTPPEGVRPVSLGKACVSSIQCQSRDPHSQCLDGRCECVQNTPKCSSSHTQCLNNTFQCTSGHCISWYFVCDGTKHCTDGTDEDSCVSFGCPVEAFQCNDGTCLSRSAVCNGRWECPDGSDEARCYTGIPCDQNSFRCANGQCLPMYVFCNAVVDCFDGTDENFAACERGEGCPSNSFRCENDRCRSSAILCSGLDGCGDNSDEDRCEVCMCAPPN